MNLFTFAASILSRLKKAIQQMCDEQVDQDIVGDWGHASCVQ